MGPCKSATLQIAPALPASEISQLLPLRKTEKANSQMCLRQKDQREQGSRQSRGADGTQWGTGFLECPLCKSSSSIFICFVLWASARKSISRTGSVALKPSENHHPFLVFFSSWFCSLGHPCPQTEIEAPFLVLGKPER
jgi:hypothetical protein